jgi:predicted permease
MSWFERSSRRHQDDLAEEMRGHVEEKIEQLMRLEGLSRTEARREALRTFGNLPLMEERSREVWQWPLVRSVAADLKLAFRRLLRWPGFAVTVLLTIAIGLGANTAVFTVVNCVLLKPLPYPHSGQLVALHMEAPGAAGLSNANEGLQLSPSMYLTFAKHNRSFQSMGVWQMRYASVRTAAHPDRVNAAFVSGGVLETLQTPAMLGRWLNAADQDPRGADSTVLSYGYWQRHLSGDPAVIGRSLDVDGHTRTIVGVMPKGFRIIDQDFDLILPLAFDPTNQKLAGFGYPGIARLKPGVTLAQANADLSRLLGVWMDSWTNGPHSNPHYYEVWKITPNLRPLKKEVVGNIGSVLWVVMGTVGLVMLIACVNVANLLLVRAESRQQELSIRAALGAGRARIARELLTESVLLGMLGGAISMGVALAGLRLLKSLGPTDLPRLNEVSLDGWSVGFTFLLAVISGILFGSIPAIKCARAKASALMSGTSRTASAGGSQVRARNLLVAAQVAMAMVLLVSAALMIRTFAALRHVDPGFSDAAQIETMGVFIPEQMAADPHTVARMQRDINDRLAAIPGVSSVGFAFAVPMDGDDPNWDIIEVEGKAYKGGDGPLRLYNYISPGYARTMGTRLVAGRDFTWDDLEQVRPMVMVSESFARENWGSAPAAIGKRVKKYQSSPWQEVIGVLEDVHVHGLDKDAPAIVYWPSVFYDRFAKPPLMNGLRYAAFVIHSDRAGTQSLAAQMQQAVWSVNAELPIAQVGTMQQLYTQSMARTSFTLVMLAIAGSMALALSIIGIYGVISYSVSQRTREIGIRLALGAQKDGLRWMFVRSALILTVAGVVVGFAAAAGLSRLMANLLFGVSPFDPLSFAMVPIVLTLAAALASYLPACRAVSVNPADTLRAE